MVVFVAEHRKQVKVSREQAQVGQVGRSAKV